MIPHINIPANYPPESANLYRKLTLRIFRYYERQVPEVCDLPPDIDVSDKGSVSDSGASIETANAQRVQIELEPNHPELILQSSFEIMSHGIAHVLLYRKVGGKQNGQYTLFPGEAANCVHCAMNDYENALQEGRKQGVYWRYRYIFESWRRPRFRLLILDLKALYEDRGKIAAGITTGTMPKGRHKYV